MPRVAHLSVVHRAQDPRVFHRECITLAEAGFETHLLLPHPRSEWREGVRLHALPRVEGRYRRLMLWPRIFREARALGADLYHFHGPELIPVAYALKKATGARIVYDMHEDFYAGRGVEGRLIRMLERWCFRWVDHVVISDAAYERFIAASGVPVTLIGNYIQPPVPPVAQERAAPPPFRLVYAGVLSEGRGLATLLDLAEVFKRDGRSERLDVAGVCYLAGQRRRAEQRLQQQGLGDVVERTAWDQHVPWRQLMQRVARAHVGLVLMDPHPNAEQVIPTKFYEYLHFGLPIICSNFPLWKRFVEEHECGRAVPPGNAQAVMEVLRQWTDEPARYRRFAAGARAAAPRYRWPVMGRRLVKLYHALLR